MFLMAILFFFGQQDPILNGLYTSSHFAFTSGNGCPWFLSYWGNSDASVPCMASDGSVELWEALDQFYLKYSLYVLVRNVFLTFAFVWFGSLLMVVVICR